MEKNKVSQDSIKIFNRRSFIITAIGLILSFIVSIRLFSLQILNFSFYQKKSVENKVSVKATPPLRGDIFDNDKNLVAANASLYEFVIYKNLNKNYLDEINKLNNLINLDLKISNISDKLKLFNPYTPFILSRANWEQIVEFEKNKFLFTSIKIIESKKRYYPHKNLSLNKLHTNEAIFLIKKFHLLNLKFNRKLKKIDFVKDILPNNINKINIYGYHEKGNVVDCGDINRINQLESFLKNSK